MEFSRQEYWSGLPCPSPGDLPNLGFKPGSPALQADSLPTELLGKPKAGWSPIFMIKVLKQGYHRSSKYYLQMLLFNSRDE